MTVGIILTLCALVLLAYIFDFTSSKTKIPSVILLLALGYLVKQLCILFDVNLPDLQGVLPILGTIGLVLIVLEGSLELELDKGKLPLIGKSVIVACIPIMIMAFGLAFALHYASGYDFKSCLASAIPLCIISSSIAIPSVRNYAPADREFVVYESSISDIIGVIFFNFVVLHTNFGAMAFGSFFLQLCVIIVVSFVATGALSFLLSRIDHHIKFVPIISLVILIHEVSKIFNLPSLVFILVLGLFLNNLNRIRHIHWIQKLNPRLLRREIHKFKEITIEATFLVRALFFLLFGYVIETRELISTSTLIWSVSITASIYVLRIIVLKLSGIKLNPLVFVAPRGLITILLFLSVSPNLRVPLIDRSLLIQIIIMTALVMMIGSMMAKKAVAVQEEVVG
ncbi:sodium:proton antiporter [Pedobacter sp. BS3]|uniref:sodium:proton antiporter n=1 Tax=Pedobacter sp. BS3 TaxID=2567937 RepID=UPI0011EF9586|nr:sodium:proton antiporter [Pedobacter sp. BS3]TZF84092.1 sodium:proton antiporter [Pedobacter sp. BS3]